MSANRNWRGVYKCVTDPEVFLDSDNIRTLMGRCVDACDSNSAGQSMEELLIRLQAWKETQRVAYKKVFELAEAFQFKPDLQRILLKHTTPMASALGAWLQGMSAPGVFEDDVQLKLLIVLACDVGVGKPECSRYDEFKTLLRRNDLSAYAVPADELHSLAAINDPSFALPALLLAMSRRSDAFAPEICGVDLLLRTLGLLPCWQVLALSDRGVIDWNRLDLDMPYDGVGGSDLRTTSAWVVERFRHKGIAISARIDRGAAWCLAALIQWEQTLVELCEASLDPEHAVTVMLQERAREGAVYHHRFKLNGRSLASWFRQAQEDPLPLVRALAESRLVCPGDADGSMLINGLIDPNGPMFRVFSKDDVEILRRWINHIGVARPASPAATTYAENASSTVSIKFPIRQGNPALGLTPGNLREAYFLLQGRALSPMTRRFAVDYVEQWLEHARASIDRTERSLPPQWQPGVLREWLLDRHDQNGKEFEQSHLSEMPSREEVINSTLQLAPLTLIDGAWLQGFTDCQLASSRIGYYLFQTYWDELGNGVFALNHPKIYRDVLRQMGIELPPTGSREFSFDLRFDDASFRLPVYWLCLGKLPATCLSIILGMNLAMEFSGVGGSYRSAHRFLKHYGFSSHFVDIHNTIDNISTGHTAWAAHAIDTYMRKVTSTRNDEQVAIEWGNLRAGYESLHPLPSRKFNRGYFSSSASSSSFLEPYPTSSLLFHHEPVMLGT